MTDTDAAGGGDQHPEGDHFREEDWLDFARALGNANRRARVAQHLEDGCPECEKTLRLWSAVLKVADQEAAAGPPDHALQEMKRRFADRPRPGLGQRLAAQVALVFDSFRQPQLAGMRSLGFPARQLLYKAGRYTIKLQVERARPRDRWSIVGQILDEGGPAGALREIAVRALSGRRTLDRTLTNALGEFQLEPGRTADLQIAVDVPAIGTFTVVAGQADRTGGRSSARTTQTTGRSKRARPR